MQASWPQLDLQAAVDPQESARFWSSVFRYHKANSNLQALVLDQMTAAVYAFPFLNSTVHGMRQLQNGYADAAFEHKLPFRTDWCTPRLGSLLARARYMGDCACEW